MMESQQILKNQMELSPKQQTVELIKSSEKILLLTHQNPDGDALGSLLALSLVLKSLGKEPTAVSSDPVPGVFRFLPLEPHLSKDFSGIKDFVISVDTTNTKVDKLSYKNLAAENKLNIIITPLAGSFEEKDISCAGGSYKYDLIIVLDSPDLERLGSLYDSHMEMFFETPVINIDHHPGNDYFGKVNWVDLTATSTSEILVALIESLSREKPLLDAEVATALLTGIIVDTGSFQNTNTTPKSFTVAAQLVAAGARQQEIIRSVFKTKTLSTLKLWGKVLSNMQEEMAGKFIWSKVTKEDYLTANAVETDTSGVIDELLKTAPGIDFALLLSERTDGLHGSMRAARVGVDVSAIAKMFGGGGHQAAAAFQLPGKTLAEMQEEILTKVRDHQRKQN